VFRGAESYVDFILRGEIDLRAAVIDLETSTPAASHLGGVASQRVAGVRMKLEYPDRRCGIDSAFSASF
jgi:hypothetical protein